MDGRLRLASYALCHRNQAVLLCRISDAGVAQGMWTLPGGGLKWGEHPLDGMRRELHEETGLTGRVVGLLGVDSRVFEANERHRRPVQSVRIVYEVECAGDPKVVEVDGTVDEARWVELAELEDYPHVNLVSFALNEAGLA